jgi:citrate synthase
MRETLTITDNRTGRRYEVPIEHGTLRATRLREIKLDDGDFGLVSYDPAMMNTASCSSACSHVDGERGVLLYRGHPIEQLAERCGYLEVAYLLLEGELPTRAQRADWEHQIKVHTLVHENLKKFVEGFRYDAHPMGMLISAVAALSTFYPEARRVDDPENRRHQIHRLLGKMPTLAAFAYRHLLGFPYVYPDNDLSYTGNLLSMLFRMTEPRYEPDPVLEKALDVLFILHADHGQNCGTTTMRCVGSSLPDPYCATAAACAALYGPLHGGANEQALRMLERIGSRSNVPDFIKRVKAGEARLMGFGHRIYKNYDPRARIIQEIGKQVFERTGRNPLLDIALELERIALQDEYFVSRKLYPNVDFYSGLIYQSMGFPISMFPVLFAIPRTAGWVAQWNEALEDPEQKILRPRQVYSGPTRREVTSLDDRG